MPQPVFDEEQQPAPEQGAVEQPGGVDEQPPPRGGADENTERIVVAAMHILYDPKGAKGIVKMLKSGEPVRALATTAGFLFRLLFEESNKSAPPDAMLGAVPEVVGRLTELAEASGVAIPEEAQAQAIQAVQQALQQKLQAGPAGQPPAEPQPQPQPEAQPRGGLIQQAMGA
jgi:hypothetical protein